MHVAEVAADRAVNWALSQGRRHWQAEVAKPRQQRADLGRIELGVERRAGAQQDALFIMADPFEPAAALLGPVANFGNSPEQLLLGRSAPSRSGGQPHNQKAFVTNLAIDIEQQPSAAISLGQLAARAPLCRGQPPMQLGHCFAPQQHPLPYDQITQQQMAQPA